MCSIDTIHRMPPMGAGSSAPMAEQSPIIPLFALPGVVLFPHVYLPFHIFEPRYREMIQDAAAANGQVGIISYDLSDGDDFDEADRLLSIGTIGQIEDLKRLPDGRFNIYLRGLCRFRLEELVPGRAYRRGRVTILPDEPGLNARQALRRLPNLRAIYGYLNPEFDELFRGIVGSNRPDRAFTALTNALIALLDLAFPLTQDLLELDRATDRLAGLSGVLREQMGRARLIQELQNRRELLEEQDPTLN